MTSATIYVLCDSRESDPVARVRYVGRTVWATARRLASHRYSAMHGGKTRTACWIRSVLAADGDVLIEAIETVAQNDCDAAERAAIARYRALGCRLTNHTDGGGGILNADAETRAKIGAVSRGNKYWLGRKHTPEARAKMAAASSGKPMHPNTRAALYSAETRARQASTMRRKELSAETLAQKQDLARRVLHSPESRAKLRLALSNPEHRAAISARQSTPESKARLAANGRRGKGRKMTPEWCAQRAAYAHQHRHSDATKQKMSQWQRGANGPRAKLTWDQVGAIRQRYQAGGVYMRELAQEYGVSTRAILLVVHGKTWAA